MSESDGDHRAVVRRPRPEDDQVAAVQAVQQPKRARITGERRLPNDISTVRLDVAYSEDKGTRPVMEDVATVALDGRAPDQLDVDIRVCFCGVFDGHGGRDVAELAASLLHGHTLDAGLKQLIGSLAAPGAKLDVKVAKAAITQGFAAVDAACLQKCESAAWPDGACAVTVWAIDDTLLVANVGDAKAVLARIADKDIGQVPAGTLRALVLSKDHLALYPTERARIVKTGGHVTSDGRLNGRMQVSRSFGDLAHKSSGCICVPDIAAFRITPRDRFLLLGCDGFWSVFEPQAAVDLAAGLLQAGRDPKAVTARLLNEAVRERRAKDNVTCMLMHFVRTDGEATRPATTST